MQGDSDQKNSSLRSTDTLTTKQWLSFGYSKFPFFSFKDLGTASLSKEIQLPQPVVQMFPCVHGYQTQEKQCTQKSMSS